MAKVGIVMGSDSDMPVMAKAAEILDKFGIDYEMTIISAHREPDLFFKWARKMPSLDKKLSVSFASTLKWWYNFFIPSGEGTHGKPLDCFENCCAVVFADGCGIPD
mgnify:CR=1 FL=1